MATLVDTLTFDAVGGELKAYLLIGDSLEDDNIRRWLIAADRAGDLFMNNPFIDSSGVDVAIPEDVKLGVFEWVRAAREFLLTNASAGVTGVKTDVLSQNWAGGGLEPARAFLDAAKVYWLYFRKEIWR